MPDTGEDHGEAEAVGGGDDVLIFDGAAGLDDGGGAGCGDGFESVREREEGVRGGDGALEGKDGFHGAESGGVDAAHLSGAHADGLAVARVDDSVRFDVLANAPGEDEAAEFFGSRRAPGDDLDFGFGDAAGVGILKQQAAGNVFDNGAGRRGSDFDEAEVLLDGEALRASAVKAVPRWLRQRAWRFLLRPRRRQLWLMPMTPPNAETGSQARAFW